LSFREFLYDFHRRQRLGAPPPRNPAHQIRAALRRRSARRDWLAVCGLVVAVLVAAGTVWALVT
jgi:hypothetical protein